MPKKSRRIKALQSKRKKIRQQLVAEAPPQPVAAQTVRPVAPAELSAPSAGRPAHRAALSAHRYPYVTAELRRIGILAGIMLVILIVLAVALP